VTFLFPKLDGKGDTERTRLSRQILLCV